jgi:excisionase family DNA binding protein
MENPFDIIQQKLDKIILLIEELRPKETINVEKNEKEIMTIDEAADLLCLAKPTLYGLTSTRKLPHFKKGKRLYFIKADLVKWIQEGKVKTMKEIENDATNYLHKKKNSQRYD